MDDPDFGKADPVDECSNSPPNGATLYYNGETPKDYSDNAGKVWVGQWIRSGSLIFGTTGSIVNPMDQMDEFNQMDQTVADVNDLSYPKVESVGCSGCPVLT
uniref:Uncharacterized protein n=1 Tax=Panagrolaimus sp. ES5 TaxID=591445 RepID=A0AC34GGF8_9BILA